MKVVVVAAGDLARGDERLLDGAGLVVAADGGATALDRVGRRPDRLVGDLDSVAPELVERLVAAGTVLERHPVDKDASDTELAVSAALAAGAGEVVILGAAGGARLDHELATLLLLADPAHAGHDLRIVRGGTAVRAVHGGGRLRLEGAVGDLVTLLAVGGDAVGVTATGVRWPLERETLALGRSRGLSNEIAAADASVGLERGALLVVETTTRNDFTRGDITQGAPNP